MKLGVLGGTFDPVHIGHLMVAEEVRASLGLSEVVLVPAGQPVLKPAHPITSGEHRLKMLRLATSDKSYFNVSTMELERQGPSYTVETMAELKDRFGGEDDLFFILGWDSLEQLSQWREPERLIQLCRIAAVPRPGYNRPSVLTLEASIPGISKRVELLEEPNVDVSSSVIRELAARGMPYGHLVPEPVAEYIKQHKLYTAT